MLTQNYGRLLRGARSTELVQDLASWVVYVQRAIRSIRRILLASGGDFHTFDNLSTTARLAKPLGASVTVLHVLSQQSLVFEGCGGGRINVEEFLVGTTPEARTLRDAATLLNGYGVPTQAKGRAHPRRDRGRAAR